jgi:hypothetical protein
MNYIRAERPQNIARQQSMKYILNWYYHVTLKHGPLHNVIKAKSKHWIWHFLEVLKEKQKGTELEIIF